MEMEKGKLSYLSYTAGRSRKPFWSVRSHEITPIYSAGTLTPRRFYLSSFHLGMKDNRFISFKSPLLNLREGLLTSVRLGAGVQIKPIDLMSKWLKVINHVNNEVQHSLSFYPDKYICVMIWESKLLGSSEIRSTGGCGENCLPSPPMACPLLFLLIAHPTLRGFRLMHVDTQSHIQVPSMPPASSLVTFQV